MKKQSILVFVLIFTSILFADTFEGKMILRVNGHDNLLPDVFAQYYWNTYLEKREDIMSEIIGLKEGNVTVKSISLKDEAAKISYKNDSDPENLVSYHACNVA